MSKNIVVFGAASAIAQETIKLWAKKSASFVLIDRNEDHLNIVATDAKTRGAQKAFPIIFDLSKPELHSKLIEQITQELGSIDVAFIAYGTLTNQAKAEMHPDYALQELNINFTSTVSLLLYIAAQMEKQNSGTIAAISSVAGDRGRKSNYVYGSAKGALSLFLQGLRHRLYSKEIHVVTIKPGFVDTPMTKEFKKGILWAKPQTVAKGIVKAIEKKKSTVYVPWFWRYIMLVIRFLPERIFLRTNL